MSYARRYTFLSVELGKLDRNLAPSQMWLAAQHVILPCAWWQNTEGERKTNAVNLILERMHRMQEKLQSVRQGQEEAAERIKRSARKESYQLKRRGNKLQHKFNDQVADKVAAAAAAIGKVEKASTSSKALLNRTAKELKEGIALLAHRQKVIKLADQSEAGWVVIEEYEGDDLADNFL